jgi:hypothetical protein
MTPDYFSPLEGWRAFGLTQGNAVLRSVVQKVPWPTVESGEACCLDPGLGFGGHRHVAEEPCPKERCTCGFYAYKTREQAEAQADQCLVLARVALWGVVVIHEHGYRAARMRVEELFIPQGLDTAVAALMDRYPVPLHVIERPSWTSGYQSAPSTSNPSQYRSRMYYQPLDLPGLLSGSQPLHQPTAPPNRSPLWRWLTVPGGHQPKQAAQFIKQLTDAEVQQLVSELRERSERAERGQS